MKFAKMLKAIFIFSSFGFLMLVSLCIADDLPSGIQITIDPRMELLGVVQSLGGYGERFGLITILQSPYKKDVDEYFAPFKDHPAVSLFDEMSIAGFAFNAPPAAMLNLSLPPELEEIHPISEETVRRTRGKEKFDALIEQLRDFAEKSNFMDFFDIHQLEFDSMIQNVRKYFGDINPVEALEDYYGIKQKSYNIILAPLFQGNYGPRLENEDGAFDIFNIVSPISLEENSLKFGSANYFEHLAWHEFSHSFINPITELHKDEFMKYSSLFDPVKERMKTMVYSNWITTINEHIVRAVTTRLNALHKGAGQSRRILSAELQRGFFYVPALCDKLIEYEAKRDVYPKISDFYPNLIAVFKEFSERENRSRNLN